MPTVTIVQPDGAGSAGAPDKALTGAWLDQPVELRGEDEPTATFQHTLLYTPEGSSAALSTPTAATAKFTPDVLGSYRVETRKTLPGLPASIVRRVVRVTKDSTGANERLVSAALNEIPEEADYGGNTRGSASLWDFNMSALQDRIDAIDGPVDLGDVQGVVTIDLSTGSYFTATLTGATNVRFVNGPSAGFTLDLEQGPGGGFALTFGGAGLSIVDPSGVLLQQFPVTTAGSVSIGYWSASATRAVALGYNADPAPVTPPSSLSLTDSGETVIWSRIGADSWNIRGVASEIVRVNGVVPAGVPSFVKHTTNGALIPDAINVLSGTVTEMALPVASAWAGKAIVVKKASLVGDVTITAGGSDLIDGATSYALAGEYALASFLADDTDPVIYAAPGLS